MARQISRCPPVLALFQKRIEGDDALLQLARLRFEQAGLGPEFYSETVAELEHLLRFRPMVQAPAVVHLARWIDILDADHRRLIRQFGSAFSGRLHGIVVHDQHAAVTRRDEYLSALRRLSSDLGSAGGPCLFIEYAAGLAPDDFLVLSRSIDGLEHVGICIDIGHFAIRRVRDLYAAAHAGRDVCGLRLEDPGLRIVIREVQETASAVRELVIDDVRAICSIGSPVHVHLHDGHPLSRTSFCGVSDHLSFFAEVPLPFEFEGRRAVPGIFGPEGLRRIVETVMGLPGGTLTLSLEIHPTGGRLPLDDASPLFDHWRDRGNAERMNHWLSVLKDNYNLVLRSCTKGAVHEDP